MGKTKDGRKIAKKFIAIDIVLILLLGVVALILAIQSFAGGGLFGYGGRIVMSTSMEKNPETDVEAYDIGDIPVRSFVLIKLVPTEKTARERFYAGLREGDVLTFVYKVIGGNVTITHRVHKIERTGGGYIITLRGDNGVSIGTQVIDTADVQSENRVIGKVIYCSPALGVFVCIVREPLFLLSVCIAVLSVVLVKELLGERNLPNKEPLPREGNMKDRAAVILLAIALAVCCFALAMGTTYGLYHETVSTQTHLVAGTLKATLMRHKLTTVNIGEDGNFVRSVDDADKDFSASTQENIFGITQGTLVAPSSSFNVEMSIGNSGNVAFFYYVEVVCNSMISDTTFASMLKISVETEHGERRETLISEGLSLGDDSNGLGTVEAGGSENFTATLEFLDDENNNSVESKFVMFDLRIHAVQKVGA